MSVDKGNHSGGSSLDAFFRSLQGITNQALGSRFPTTTGELLELLMRFPDFMVNMGRAGKYLKDLREVAGLSIDDLAKHIKLENPDLLRSIEDGKTPVNLDILYRLASFHARNDPLSFMMNFSREHAPLLWQILKISGIEKLIISAEREIRFINIYRSRDIARSLDPEKFDRVLGFMQQSFDLALDFLEDNPEAGERPKSKPTPKPAPQRKVQPKKPTSQRKKGS